MVCLWFGVVLSGASAFAQTPTTATDDASSTHLNRALVWIIPDVLDNQVVYPTTRATVVLDPLQTYTWERVVLPPEWATLGYYVEAWDSFNKIIPGFAARRLTSSTLDLSSIDTSLYPEVRLVLFRPQGTPEIDYAQAVYIEYTSAPNTRLFVFVGLMALLAAAVVIGAVKYRVGVREVWQGTVALLARAAPVSGARQMTIYALMTVLWAGWFGVVAGLFVGGIQVVYLLIKLPFLLLGAFVFSVLSLLVFSALAGLKASALEVVTRSTGLIATIALALASFTSVLIFYILIPQTHDQLLVSMVIFFGVAGVAAAGRLYAWLRQTLRFKALALTAVWVVAYGVVVLQLGWLLRPWVGVLDPVHNSVPFSRLTSGNVFVELAHTIKRL